jgi:formate dehydrogenase iron-sulfur subunit
LVGLWKGVSKPLALLAMGAAVLAGFFHYVRVGPQIVEEDELPPGHDPAVHEVDPSVHTYDPKRENRS